MTSPSHRESGPSAWHPSSSLPIVTASERLPDGLFGYAWCPICGDRHESTDHGFGERFAISIAVARLWTHLETVHRLKRPDSVPTEEPHEPQPTLTPEPDGLPVTHGTLRSLVDRPRLDA